MYNNSPVVCPNDKVYGTRLSSVGEQAFPVTAFRVWNEWRDSVVRTSVFGWPTFPGLNPIYG